MKKQLKVVIAGGYSVLVLLLLLAVATAHIFPPIYVLLMAPLGLPWSAAVWLEDWMYSMLDCPPLGPGGARFPCPAADRFTFVALSLGPVINGSLLWWWALRKSRAIAFVIVGLVVLPIVAGFGALAYYLWMLTR